MYNENKKVTVELVNEKDSNAIMRSMTNPINVASTDTDKLSKMIIEVLDKEFPKLKNNSLLHSLVLYSLVEKINTVQSVENVLSYIKENRAKEVHDVCIKNGEIRIKCSI